MRYNELLIRAIVYILVKMNERARRSIADKLHLYIWDLCWQITQGLLGQSATYK